MGAIRSVMSSARRAHLPATIAIFAALSAGASFAQSAQSPAETENGERAFQLRIASMSAAGARNETAKAEAPGPSWRHTFGSERRTEEKLRPVPFSADVVVIQDVTNLGPVRQMLPARSYRVVASRQILENANPARQGAEVATTAIAVSRSAALRAVAHEHLLELADPPSEASLPLSAAIAVKLLNRNGAFWVITLDVAACPLGSALGDIACEAAKRQLDLVDAWLTNKLAAGETVIVAGRFQRTLGDDSLPGKLGQLNRFPKSEQFTGSCSEDGGGIARTYVLIAPGRQSMPPAELRGHLEPVDDKKPEMGCALLAEVSF